MNLQSLSRIFIINRFSDPVLKILDLANIANSIEIELGQPVYDVNSLLHCIEVHVN